MAAYERLMARLRRGEAVILDGPTGTELQARGAPMDPGAWCGPATLENDQLLVDIHSDYIAAGSEVVTANTFASSRLMLGAAGLADRAEEIVTRAVAAARKARDLSDKDVVVAGSLSHMMPIAGGLATPDLGRLPGEAAMADAFGALASQLKNAGCDLIILEMMYHPARVPIALKAALATGLPVWFGASARRGADGSVVAFHTYSDVSLDDIAALIPDRGVDVAGVMHTGGEVMTDALGVIRKRFSGPLMAYPDSGYFEMPDWRFIDVVTPGRYETFCAEWLAAGARLLGGCCGLGVEHIRAAVRARDAWRSGMSRAE